jgi:hypothetical protein
MLMRTVELLSLPLLHGCGIGGWVTPAIMPYTDLLIRVWLRTYPSVFVRWKGWLRSLVMLVRRQRANVSLFLKKAKLRSVHLSNGFT